MNTPLNASASSAGALLSSSTFEVPQFQREYSWQQDEVDEFWRDLKNNLLSPSYFLGLIILTEENGKKHVVDGQQRLVTLTLLANSLYHEALSRDRKALADRIQADFLRSINYSTDATDPRVMLSDDTDNTTLQSILNTGKIPSNLNEGSVSERIAQSYQFLSLKLAEDLKVDSFKRLGQWTEFLTHRVYFAVFVHPDPTSAYQVYEVINTRGKELTTADLLKNYILSETDQSYRPNRYKQWQVISKQFSADGSNTFVQYIRHVVTVQSGYILPKDLFGFLARRAEHSKTAPSPNQLMNLLESYLPLYSQIMDPTLGGPAETEALSVFAALNSLGVIAVRPILLAVTEVPNSLQGMKYILRLVVRRIAVGNLGTGNVERRFGEAARRVKETGRWETIVEDLKDLNPSREDFIEQIRKRSYNKAVLAFLRRSILEHSITPSSEGTLHFIWTRQMPEWPDMSEEDGAYWAATIGNTFLSTLDRRPLSITDWSEFKKQMFAKGIKHEWDDRLSKINSWNATTIDDMGRELAKVAGEVWYD